MKEKTGILICGHGSRHPQARSQFESLVEIAREKLDGIETDFGYLEFASPTIRQTIQKMYDKGCRKIHAAPAMLFAAGHMKNDIPSLLRQESDAREDLDITCAREMGFDLKLIQAAGERIRRTLEQSPKPVDLGETALLVVGRGASDPDANSNICKVMRLLWEGLGFGWGETAYSGVTFPLTEAALDRVVRLGYRTIVVFPYFLFTGVLIDRIHAAIDQVAERHPHITFLKAPYLGTHPLVVDTLIERVAEIEQELNVMNCRLCKYRAPMIGFENEVALPQRSHHHHVEGILSSDNNPGNNHDNSLGNNPGNNHNSSPDDNHDHDHPHTDHDHADESHHHPYPHTDHPLGPMSMKKPV